VESLITLRYVRRTREYESLARESAATAELNKSLAEKWKSLSEKCQADDDSNLSLARRAIADYEKCEGLPERALEVGK